MAIYLNITIDNYDEADHTISALDNAISNLEYDGFRVLSASEGEDLI